MSSEKSVTEAIKELRKRLAVTQVEFASRLNKAYSTVQRYEAGRTVPQQDMARLCLLARQYGFDDLAEIFRNQLVSKMPSDILLVIQDTKPARRASGKS